MVRKQVAKVPIEQGEQFAPLRCWRCDKLLNEAAAPGTVVRCLRCGARSRVQN